jgi:hypothetical protein
MASGGFVAIRALMLRTYLISRDPATPAERRAAGDSIIAAFIRRGLADAHGQRDVAEANPITEQDRRSLKRSPRIREGLRERERR